MDIDLGLAEVTSLIKDSIILNRIISEGNYTKAAKKLGMQQPNISAAVKHLESKLDVKLFTSDGRKMIPTEAALKIADKIKMTEAAIYDMLNFSLDTHNYRGVIKLWMTDGLGSFCIAHHITDFQNSYPGVMLDITCTNDTPDIGAREADVAVVYQKPSNQDSALISQYNVRFGLFASRKYARTHGLPKDLNDLIQNHYICDRQAYGTELPEWKAITDKAAHIVSSCNSTNILVQMVHHGAGIALSPVNAGYIDKDWINVMPDFILEHPYWLLSHVDTKDTPKIRGLLDYLKRILNRL